MEQDTLPHRLSQAWRMKADFYSRAAADPSLSREALWLVIIPASLLALLFLGLGLSEGEPGKGIITSAIGVIMPVSFFMQAGLTYFIGRHLFHSSATYSEVQRALGYAFTTYYAQMLINIIPCVGLITLVWPYICEYKATRSALGLSKGAAITVIILVYIVSAFLVGGVIVAAAILVPDVALFFEWLLGRLGFLLVGK